MTLRSIFQRSIWCGLAMVGANQLCAQTDPGPRGGTANAGAYYPTLNAAEQAFFQDARDIFQEVTSVKGAVPGEDSKGLGPSFNGNSCTQCHSQPAVGGSSPGMASKQNPLPNPQVALATLHGAMNAVPSFITSTGPVREARFVNVPGSNRRDGGVHGLYTIRGRSDAPGCQLHQPDFARELANRNVVFRIPTPTFGLGLVEMTSDDTLRANLAANAPRKSALGIGGSLNTIGNDGTVTRFGWKAQNKSLLIFAGEAYNVEMGVSNEVFPNERSAVAGCVFNSSLEDATGVAGTPSDTQSFTTFMRLLAPPTATTSTVSELNGQALFSSVGCALCHSPSLATGAASYTGMSNVTYHPFSDFAVHHMGANLADGVSQGDAGPDEFRTAPLWGLGQRLFFLHDGRTSDLLQAIRDHANPPGACGPDADGREGRECASEANAIIQQFNSHTAAQKQDLLNFLRSL